MELKELFGDWYTPMEPLLGSKIFEDIGIHLMQAQQEGKHILPGFDDMFRPFSQCKPSDLKAILLLPAPYDIKGYADGLAMSTKASVTPSWLKHFHAAWKEDFDIQAHENRNDLTYLAKQGVLLLNAAFTCEPGDPVAHRELWRPFTEQVLQMISHYFEHIVIIMAGSLSQEFIHCIEEPKHTILTCFHPASADYVNEKWDHQHVFKRCNRILIAKGIAPIQWYLPVSQKITT